MMKRAETTASDEASSHFRYRRDRCDPCGRCVACLQHSRSGSPGVHRSEPAVVLRADRRLQRSLWTELCRMPRPRRQGRSRDRTSDPVFLAIADDAVIRRIASNGVPGTPMPAFAQSAGGMLTDKQIDAIVARNSILGRNPMLSPMQLHRPIQRRLPAIRNAAPTCIATYCSSCHGADGRGGKQGQLDCGWLIPRAGKRPTSSHDRDCRPTRAGRSGLAR